MLDDTLPVTLQFQLRGKLLEKIDGRVWTPGTQIPSERELCAEYGVSRITVREVLKTLVQEGYLTRKQGKGTFVALPKFEHELTSSYSLSQEIEKEGLDSHFQMLSFRRISAPGHVQAVFGLSSSDEVCEITRLRFIGGELFAWERAYTPSTLMMDATEAQVEKEGLYFTIYRCSGLMAEEAEVEVEAVNCSDEIAALLKLKKKAAVLYLRRVTTAKERCIEYCESYVRSETYKYKYKQRLRKKPYDSSAHGSK